MYQTVRVLKCARGCFEPCIQQFHTYCIRNLECPIERELRIFPSSARRSWAVCILVVPVLALL